MKTTLAVLLALLTGTPGWGETRDANGVETASFPQEQKDNYELFKIRCSKCHTLAKPLNARIRGVGWKFYIQKMMRKAGSGINSEDAQLLLAFLDFYYERVDAKRDGKPAPSQPPASPSPPPPPP